MTERQSLEQAFKRVADGVASIVKQASDAVAGLFRQFGAAPPRAAEHLSEDDTRGASRISDLAPSRILGNGQTAEEIAQRLQGIDSRETDRSVIDDLDYRQLNYAIEGPARYQRGDHALAQILRRQGFDGPPRLVDADGLDHAVESGWMEMARGVRQPQDAKAAQAMERMHMAVNPVRTRPTRRHFRRWQRIGRREVAVRAV